MGLSIQYNGDNIAKNGRFMQLLAENRDLQVMLQSVEPGSAMWIDPADDPYIMEFFYLLEGHLEIHTDEESWKLSPHDSFHISDLKKTIRLSSSEQVKLLYVVNTTMFKSLMDFDLRLKELLEQVEAKDVYTRGHGRRVMQCSLLLAERLGMKEMSVQNLVLASLLHDIGKCTLPDDILTKETSLTVEEYDLVMLHPIESRRILEPHFGKEVAEIAELHHERLDGSGYPYGLSGDDLPLAVRIISISDTFDAITSKRSYNIPRSYEDALIELERYPDQYDQKLVALLREIYEGGKLVFPAP